MNSEQAPKLPPYRIGHGYDVHRFGEGDAIVLGGVKIPHHSGFIAHSDGDVLIHALCDALLGGIAAGDIGKHFPDTADKYKNIASSVLLDHTNQLLKKEQYTIVNIDLTIVAQSPKMAPHISAMCENIAADLDVGVDYVGVKATTTEGMGFTGRGEGIETHAVALLVPAT